MSQNISTTPLQPPPQAFEPITVGISEDSKQALLEQWRAIKRHKLPILGLMLMVMLVATVVAFALTPIYRATTTLMIEPGRGNKVVSIDDVYSSGAQAKEFYQSQIEILKSREVAVRTAASLKLWERKDYDPRTEERGGLTSLIKGAIGVRSEPVEWTTEKLAEAAGRKLMNQISVEPVRLSQLVKVSVETPDKALSVKLANAVAQSYIEADRDARFKVTQQANVWLTSRMSELLKKLTESETALQAYRETQGMVNLDGSTQTLVAQQAAGLNARMIAAQTRRIELESAYQQISSITNGDYSKVPAVVSNISVASGMQKEIEAEQRLASLSSNLGTEHSAYKEALASFKSVRETTRRQREAVAKSILNEYKAARRTERQLESDLAELRGTVQESNRQEFQLGVLEREVATNRSLYDLFMSRAKETSLTTDLQSAVARVVDSAAPPEAPVRPKKVQMVVIAGILSLMLGSLVAMLMAKLDNTVKTGEELEDRLQLPVLTTLPLLGKQAPSTASRMFLEQPHSQHAEAIRTARTGVLLSSIDRSSKVILVTSSLPGEGKTTLATNLALAHAQTRCTILVDADLRKPQVGLRLGVPANAKGLSNLIAGTATLSECMHPIKGSPLMVIPSGDIPPNTLELLHSKRFEEVLTLLRQTGEIVMIDSPPVEVVSDSLVIAPHADGTIYVVKAMATAYPMARKGIGHLQRVGAKILGVVVNSLDFKQATRYYGMSKGYDNDSYYGAPQQPTKSIGEQRNKA